MKVKSIDIIKKKKVKVIQLDIDDYFLRLDNFFILLAVIVELILQSKKKRFS